MLFSTNEQLIRKDITIQVTGDCNLACTYCYQHSKNNQTVDIEKAKKFLRAIVRDDQKFFNGYTSFSSEKLEPCIQFIGGEPLLNYKAIIELCDYYYDLCKELKPGLWNRTIFGICTNGTIYNKEIEDWCKKYYGHISIGVSIDGNEELHDTCRRFKGSNAPSYKIAVQNLEKFRKLVPNKDMVGTKFTVSPQNINHLAEATINIFDNLGFEKVPANCVYEDVWSINDAKTLYTELKKIADWILQKNYKFDTINLYNGKHKNREFAFFSDTLFCSEYDWEGSWCGGNGKMLFMQYDGKLYCCNRYSEISIGNPERDLYIGTVDDGITRTDVVKCIKSVCRDTMYDDECRKCPVARGCSDCTAYCYEVWGEFKKLKNICDMHKARVLANVYFWNKYYIQHNIDKVFLFRLPIKEAKKYIDDAEIEMLLDLSNRRLVKIIKEQQK